MRSIATRLVSKLRRRAIDVPAPRRGAGHRGVRAKVEVGYQPNADGNADPGEVVWAWIPFEEDPYQGKDRPTVVIGVAGELLAVVALTSKPHPERRDQVAVGRGSWDHEGRTSYARIDRIIGMRPDQVRREGATLERGRFDELIGALRQRPGWPEVSLEVVDRSRTASRRGPHNSG